MPRDKKSILLFLCSEFSIDSSSLFILSIKELLWFERWFKKIHQVMSSNGCDNLLSPEQVVFMIKFNKEAVFELYRTGFCRGRNGRFRKLWYNVEKIDEEERVWNALEAGGKWFQKLHSNRTSYRSIYRSVHGQSMLVSYAMHRTWLHLQLVRIPCMFLTQTKLIQFYI